MAKTLFDKVWDAHVVDELPGGGCLLYIDRHLVHEVTSPQAFDGLRAKGRKVRRPDLTFATVDHNVPTDGRAIDESSLSGKQIAALTRNCREFGVPLFGYDHPDQGIVHVIGPQLGLTLPGLTVVCGDSHTSTHGAFGAIAFGIGTTEVEHVLATQTLRAASKPKRLRVKCEGTLGRGVTAKDLVLRVIRQLGAGGGTGYAVEYAGKAIRALNMSGRMTVCNMSIEMGARCGMVAPDLVTLEYIAQGDRPYGPTGEALERLEHLVAQTGTDADAVFDREESVAVRSLVPQVSWGTTPAMSVDVTGSVPEANSDEEVRALRYMGLSPGEPIQEIAVDTVFIGSCTNARLDDLVQAASLLKRGRRVAAGIRAMVVPGSASVRAEAERLGLDQVFVNAGFEWHRAGCSMCLGMNGDLLRPGQRSASTSNRPYEGRQGPGSRTHLVSPLTATATALTGNLTDPRRYM